MNYKNRVEYGKGLATMGNWRYTTYLRGEYKFSPKYVDTLCKKLVRSSRVNKVFASIEKDRTEEHNHLHLLLDTNTDLTRYNLSIIAGFNHKGIGNIDRVKNEVGVAKYVSKHIGKDFSYHNIFIN